jgi:hypothetical protein
MRFAIATALAGVTALTLAGAAQTPPAAPAIARTVVAGTKLPSLGSAPLYFRAVSVSIPPGQKISVSPPNGILYQLSGATEIADGDAKKITAGGGALIAGGTSASLTAGNAEPSTLLYFLLVPKGSAHSSLVSARVAARTSDRAPSPSPARQ